MLEVRSIDVAYGDLQAVWQVSLEVRQGEAVALLGPNGAGKTTTLKTIMGLMTPQSGDILLDGQSIRGRPTHEIVAAGVCLVPEGRGLFATMTVEENLRVGAHLSRNPAELAGRLDWIYATFPLLEGRRKHLAGSLSGGQQQMLTIARALMARPRLLILDEPSFGVAPLVVRDIFSLLADLSRQGITMLLVEQSVGLALDLCQRAYVLESGRVVAAGPVATLRTDEHIRAAYLGTIA